MAKWFIKNTNSVHNSHNSHNNGEDGPYLAREIQRMGQDGRITSDTLVRKETGKFMAARCVAGLIPSTPIANNTEPSDDTPIDNAAQIPTPTPKNHSTHTTATISPRLNTCTTLYIYGASLALALCIYIAAT